MIRIGSEIGAPDRNRTCDTRFRNNEAWQLLNQAAADIGVNRSALVTQLEAEGRISVNTEGRRQVLRVQPMLDERALW